MARLMPQRQKHLALPQPALVHIILHDRQPTGVAVLVPQTLEDPLRGVTLFRRAALILLNDPIDNPDERVQLRPCRRLPPPISRRHREGHHLGYRPRVDPKPTTRLATAQSLNLHRITDPSIEIHALHPPPSANRKELLAAGFLLRRNRNIRPLH